MNLVNTLRENLVAGILADSSLGIGRSDCARVSIEVAPTNVCSDLATNAALILAQVTKQPPLKLAERLQPLLQTNPYVDSCEVVKPGFINIHLSSHARAEVLTTILQQKCNYGGQTLAKPALVNIEFVSANPTGPLHIGHTRGAVVGDVLANILEKCGYQVLREYYVNDRGEQMHLLARSLYWRYCQLFEEVTSKDMPSAVGLYPGAYLIDCAKALKARDGDKWLQTSSDFWLAPLLEFARAKMMEQISGDLQALGVDFRGNFISEQALVQSGKIEKLIADLQQSGAAKLGRLPKPKAARAQSAQLASKAEVTQNNASESELSREHLLLETKRFGDSENRVLQTADGRITYFASDIAYHVDKLARGAVCLIDVFGADHSGHAKRLRAALKACHASNEVAPVLEVVSCQIVRLLGSGKPLKMSKRGGSFLELKTLLERVGRDAIRFLMLTRKSDAPLDFDLDAAVAKSHNNPVFYVQYAHARCCSVLRMAQEMEKGTEKGEKNEVHKRADNSFTDDFFMQADLIKLEQKTERLLIRDLALFPRTLENAARNLEPHRLVFALIALAAVLHAWWNEGNKDRTRRIICLEDATTMRARLALVRAAQIVLATGLQLCGVDAPDEMV